MRQISKILVLPLIALLGSCSSGNDEPVIDKPDQPQVTPDVNDALAGNPINLSNSESEVSKGTVDFGFRLMSAVGASETDNFCVSPFSAEVYLAMLANGYGEEQQQLLVEAITGQKGDIDVLNSYNAKMLKQLPIRSAGATVLSANSLWLMPGTQLQPTVAGVLSDIFSAEVNLTDLTDISIVGAVNDWVSRNTNGLIESVLDRPCDSETAVLIFNTLYYKAVWDIQFDESKTTKSQFVCADGSQTVVDMMHLDNTLLDYIQGADFDGVRLYMGNRGAYALYMLLPHEDVDFNSFIASLNSDAWRLKSVKEAYVDLAMPRFDVRYSFDLASPLSALGLGWVLESPLTQLLQGASVPTPDSMQQTVLSVNEKGAEGAAVTGGIISGGDTRPDHVAIEFNRPFVYIVEECSSSTLLFIGGVRKL